MKDYSHWLPKVENLLNSGKECVEIDIAPLNLMYLENKGRLNQEIPSIKLPNWPHFNEMTGGLRPREFTIMTGPTGIGKTSLLANMSTQLLESGVPHFVASVETGAEDFYKRNLSVLAGRDLVSRSIRKEEEEFFYGQHEALLNTERIVYTRFQNRIDHKRLLANILYAHTVYHVKVALLDNINFFLEVSDARNQLVVMDKTVHDFVVFCKQVDVHIILVMHPRKTENRRVNNEFDIKGSSLAVQEASNIMLWNPLEDESDCAGYDNFMWCREMKFVKLRKRGKNVGRRIVYVLKDERLIERKLCGF